MAVSYKDISQLTQKSTVVGTEKIVISDTAYITPSQIGGTPVLPTNLAYIGQTEGTATYVEGGSTLPAPSNSGQFLSSQWNSLTSAYEWGVSELCYISLGLYPGYNKGFFVDGSGGEAYFNTYGLTYAGYSDWSCIAHGTGNSRVTLQDTLDSIALPSVTSSDSGKFLYVAYDSVKGWHWEKTNAITHYSTYIYSAYDFSFIATGSLGYTWLNTEGIRKEDFSDWSWIKTSYYDSGAGATLTKTLQTDLNLKYEKPSGGIPKTDLASAVQTSLGKADTALQSFTESDPVFTASAAHGISSTDITNWNAKQKAITVSTSEPTSSQGSNGDIWIVI